MFDDSEIASKREIIGKATPRPWKFEEGGYSGKDWPIGSICLGYSNEDDEDIWICLTTDHVHGSELTGTDAKFDAEYIVLAANEYPAALDEIERLQVIERKAIEQSEHIQLAGLTDFEVAGLKAEIERLRKALLHIVDIHPDYGERMVAVARAALKGGE